VRKEKHKESVAGIKSKWYERAARRNANNQNPMLLHQETEESSDDGKTDGSGLEAVGVGSSTFTGLGARSAACAGSVGSGWVTGGRYAVFLSLNDVSLHLVEYGAVNGSGRLDVQSSLNVVDGWDIRGGEVSAQVKSTSNLEKLWEGDNVKACVV